MQASGVPALSEADGEGAVDVIADFQLQAKRSAGQGWGETQLCMALQ